MLTAAPEPFPAFLEEVKPILPEHYRELALDTDVIPLEPNYGLYLERDARGEVLTIAMREAGELVGYFVGFVAPGLHYSTCLTLHLDIFYLRQSHRGKAGGMVLFEAVETEAKRRGVQRMFVGSKTHMDASWLFERRGYVKVETTYSMLFRENI